jgi:glycosyltransferase involved in cell wall biosynthesis
MSKAVNAPLVSVIINCHNGERFLTEAIDSVYSQTLKNWEIILFDNASTDSTSIIAGKYDEKLKYFRSGNKLPLGEARNVAIKKACGSYLAFLDSDDIWLQNKLKVQMNEIAKYRTGRGVAVCYTDAMRIDCEGKDLLRYSQERTTFVGDVLAELMKDCFIAMSSAVIDRNICEELGAFKEEQKFVEEWDLWLRAAKKYDFVASTDVLTKIRFHSGNESRNYEGQWNEIIKMFNSLTVPVRLEKEKRRAITLFKIRFQIIRTLYQIREGRLLSLLSFINLLLMVLRHPKVGRYIWKKYIDLKMLNLFFKKYF